MLSHQQSAAFYNINFIANMSLCVCLSCGYESYILCCAEKPTYQTICLPCLLTVPLRGLACNACSRPVERIAYAIQKRFGKQDNYRPVQMQFSPPTRSSSNIHPHEKSQLSTQNTTTNHQLDSPTTGLSYYVIPLRNQPDQLPNVHKKKPAIHCTEADYEYADFILDMPLNYEPKLEKERQKNKAIITRTSSAPVQDTQSASTSWSQPSQSGLEGYEWGQS